MRLKWSVRDKPYFLLLMLFIAGYSALILGGCITEDNSGTGSNSGQPVSAWITIDFGNGTRLEYNISTRNNTVFGFLKEACSPAYANISLEYHTDPRYGVFVDSIGGVEMKQVGNTYYYWGFWVNGEYGTTSCDKAVVSEGSHIEWRYGA